jgi:hypothetical protein
MILDKTTCDEKLVFLADLRFSEQTQHSGLVDDNGAVRGRALDALTSTLTHDHDLQIRVPALLAEVVATLQSTHCLQTGGSEVLQMSLGVSTYIEDVCQHANITDKLLSRESCSATSCCGLGLERKER